MINFFPPIYGDELLYSVLGRYHLLSGNVSFKQTLKDIFKTDTALPVIDFPSNLDILAQNIYSGKMYTSQYFIDNCTLFPAYSPFMNRERKHELINIMKHENGISLKYKIGYIAGGICKKQHLFYCPECAKEEFNTTGEAYFHRTHQFQGVYVCERHKCLLKPYIFKNNTCRIEFIRLLEDNMNFEHIEIIEDPKLFDLMLHISKEIKYLLCNNLKIINCDAVHVKYLMLLRDKGFLTSSGTIKWSDLQEEFINYYNGDLLEKFDSNINREFDYNWLKSIFRRHIKLTHPVRHLLLIKFLCGGVDNFIKIQEKSLNPFGDGP